MKLLFPALLVTLVMAAPARADDATLEGYGGDGALLVGIDSKGPQFGDSAPAAEGGGGGSARPRGDGDLVAESVPIPAGGTQGAISPSQPAAEPTTETAGSGQDRKRGGRKDPETTADEPAGVPTTPARPAQEQSATIEDEHAVGSGGGGLPFTSLELAFLAAALLGLVAMGAGMRRMAAAQPRF